MFVFIKEYSPTLTIFSLYVIVPIIFEWLVKFEKYDSQATVIKITLMRFTFNHNISYFIDKSETFVDRMVFLRMASVIVFLVTLLNTLKNNESIKQNEQNEDNSDTRVIFNKVIIISLLFIKFQI